MGVEIFLEQVKKYQDSNLNISVNPKFRKLHDKFKAHPSKKSYAKLIVYLRGISNESKINISEKSVLLYVDDNNKPVFNSNLHDDHHGNSFQNYLDGKIEFDNKYQKKSALLAEKEIINVTRKIKVIPGKTKCQNKYIYYFYTSNFVGSGITQGSVTVPTVNCFDLYNNYNPISCSQCNGNTRYYPDGNGGLDCYCF